VRVLRIRGFLSEGFENWGAGISRGISDSTSQISDFRFQIFFAYGRKKECGCKLEYRVKAINSSGQSCPSNSVTVVL
jgi:hypothetical protein